MAEIVASTTCAYQRLYNRDELERAFASTLTKFAILQFYGGHRIGNSKCSSDVQSPRAKKTAGNELLSLGTPGEQVGAWMECLIYNQHTAIPEQVGFRIDFPKWLESQTPRDKRVAERLSLRYSTREVADEFEISPARVSQLRRELADSWHMYINADLSGE